MTRQTYILAAAAGSFALLAGAFFFQAIGYPPCAMCLWQRWPHVVAIGLGVVAVGVARFSTGVAWLGALATVVSAGIAAYHTGVERNWWDGPASCSGAGDALGGDLLATDIAPIVMCDDVTWWLFGLTMANYNLIFSLVLAALWIKAALTSAR